MRWPTGSARVLAEWFGEQGTSRKAVPVASQSAAPTVPSSNGSRTAPPSSSTSDASSPSEESTFPIRDFHVEGNNLLPPDRVEAILDTFTGPARRFSDIEAARDALEKEYRKLGYPTVAVTVPEQTVAYGIVTLRVYEARLKTVEVTNNWFFSDDYIRNKLPAVRLGALLHEPTVLKQLDTLNANPDVKVAPILKPTDDPEQLDMELKVKDRPPVHGKVELNNRGVPTTSRLRLNAALQYTNLFGLDHSVTLQTSQTPQDFGQVTVYSGNYLMPLGTPDHQLAFFAATAHSRARLNQSPLPVGGGLDIIGNSVIGGGRYMYSFSKGNFKHQISVGVDYKHLDQSKAMAPDGTTAVVTNAISYTPGTIGYVGIAQDQWGLTRFTATTRGYAAGLVPQGDKQDFQGDPNDPLNKPGFRKHSTGTFVVLQGGIDRYLALPKDFGLSAKVDGQWVNEPVIPTEQYFAGGMESVRGYREYEAVGDEAVHGSVELSTPPVPKFFRENIRSSLKFVAFYDLAYLWIKDATPGQIPRRLLEGTGVGLRFGLSDHLRFRYDAAWTLTNGPFSPAGSFYGHFSLEAVF
jgi:hemolysin activation/secretion protein